VKPPIAIISPFFPPTRGGLADHTDLLAQTLSLENDVLVITSPGGDTGRPYPVRPEIANWQDAGGLVAAIERLAPHGELLWQYVPHMYGRGGVNLALARAMQELKRRGRRQLLIAHEIAAPYSIFPQRFYYAWAHRRQWRAIVPSMEFVGISTEAWLKLWSAYWPGQARGGRNLAVPTGGHSGSSTGSSNPNITISLTDPLEKFQLLPSPSSLPIAPVPAGHRKLWRDQHGLAADCQVIVYFGTITAGKQFPWVLKAWRRAGAVKGPRPVALAVIGDHRRPEAEGTDAGFVPLGYLPPAEVSAALQAADVLALPFIDGVSERRTSAMAGLQHGRAVLTTFGHNTGPTLRQATFLRITPAHEEAPFIDAVSELLRDDSLRLRLEESGRQEYEKSYSWPVVANRLNSVLGRMRR
jgi:glycosyltransferase involved in cell wall biosynthesis